MNKTVFYLVSPLISLILLALIFFFVFCRMEPFVHHEITPFVTALITNIPFIVLESIAKIIASKLTNKNIIIVAIIVISWIYYIWLVTDFKPIPLDNTEGKVMCISAMPSLLVDLLTIALSFQKHKL